MSAILAVLQVHHPVSAPDAGELMVQDVLGPAQDTAETGPSFVTFGAVS